MVTMIFMMNQRLAAIDHVEPLEPHAFVGSQPPAVGVQPGPRRFSESGDIQSLGHKLWKPSISHMTVINAKKNDDPNRFRGIWMALGRWDSSEPSSAGSM